MAERNYRRRQKWKVVVSLLALVGVVGVAGILLIRNLGGRPEPTGETSPLAMKAPGSFQGDTNTSASAAAQPQTAPPASNGASASRSQTTNTDNTSTKAPLTEGTLGPTATAIPGLSQVENFKEDGFALPGNWKGAPVGNIAAKTFGSYADRTFLLTGAGKDFSGTKDNFFFVHTSFPKSNTFEAHLFGIPRASPSILCGLMMRESKQEDAPFVFVGASSASVFWYMRDSKGSWCTSTNITIRSGIEALWLKLTRDGANFTGAYSLDKTNINWSPFPTKKASIPD